MGEHADAGTKPTGPADVGGGLRPGVKWFLGGLAVVLALLVLFSIFFWRPAARVNRLLPSVGLSRLPASARDLRAERQGRLLGRHVLYARFEASVDDIAGFIESSPGVKGRDFTSMATIAFGPRSPWWMRWDTSVQGRVYHYAAEGASVWVMVDDRSHIVYVGVFESRPAWLRRLLD